jgi:hypothetical protein
MIVWIGYAALGKLEAEIRPVEVISWSWRKVRQNSLTILFVGLMGGVILGIIFDFFPFLGHRIPGGLVPLLLPVLVFAIGIGLSFGLMLGLSHEVLATHDRILPNQGIRNSLRNGVLLGLVYGLIVGILSGIIFAWVRAVVFPHYTAGQLILGGLSDGIGFGLITAGVVWLRSGGLASLQHFFLRLRLWRAGYIPWHYPRFLDYASECILLRKVGGGYIFMHRLLLDYFASLDLV